MRTTPNWSKEDLEFLKNNFLKMSKKELAKELGRTESGIQIKANRLGLRKPDKYSYNKAFFKDIDTEQKAYWLGFFYADGYTQKRYRNEEASIMLSSKDASHLKKFNKSINGNVEVKTEMRGNGFNDKKSEIAIIRLYSFEFVDYLIAQGCVPNKTKIITFPNIPKELEWSFIRGCFDGDGCICIDKSTNKPRCDFASASLKFLQELRVKLKEENVCSYIIKEKKSECYRLYIGGLENTYLFLQYLYDDASIYLNRKFNRYKTYVKELNIEERIQKNKNHRKI